MQELIAHDRVIFVPLITSPALRLMRRSQFCSGHEVLLYGTSSRGNWGAIRYCYRLMYVRMYYTE